MKNLKSFWPHALLIGFSALLIFGTLNNGHDWGGDFASYIMQAKSLVEGTPGEFVQANRFTIEHTTRTLAPVAYPWGYPAMLAPVYAGFGQDMLALKSVAVACYLLLLVFMAVAFRKIHPGIWLICLVGLFAANPVLLIFLNRLISDIPFMLVSTLGVFLVGRFAIHRRHFVSPVWDGAALGLLIAFASSIRTNGILLLATLFIGQILALRLAQPGEDERQAPRHGLLVHAMPYMVFLAVILLLRAALPGGEESHMDYLRLISPGGIVYHLKYYGLLPTDFYEGVPYPLLAYLLTIPLALLGIARRYRDDYYIVIYLLLTYILYVLWPVTQPIRFLFPILPFYLSFVLTGLQVLQGSVEKTPNRLRQAACILPVLFVFTCFSVQSISQAQDNLSRNRHIIEGPQTKPAQEMFAFVKTSTKPEDAFIFYKPRVLRMFTGRKAYSTSKPGSLSPADYLILTKQRQRRQFQPDVVAQLIDQGRIKQSYENSDFQIYRIQPIGESSKDPAH